MRSGSRRAAAGALLALTIGTATLSLENPEISEIDWRWLVASLSFLAGIAWLYREELFGWARRFRRENRRQEFLNQRMSTVEVARRCARPRTRGRASLDHPKTQAWLERLTMCWTFDLDPIDAATVMTVGQWLEIVHGQCRGRDEPLPRFFQKAYDSLPIDVRTVQVERL